jgi:RNA-directed DNA polymerase
MLANIYLHYALDLKFNELAGKSEKAKLFRFADDLVIVAENESQIRSLKKWVGYWLFKAGLTLSAKKTRMVDMSNAKRGYDSKFDFLGFKLHLRAFKDNAKRFWIARQPSERARRNLHEKLKSRLTPHLSLNQAREKLDEIWRGWVNYFRFGNSNRILYKELRSVRRCVMVYLRYKFRHQRRPVAWQKLQKRADWITQNIRPPTTIPNPTRLQQSPLPGL